MSGFFSKWNLGLLVCCLVQGMTLPALAFVYTVTNTNDTPHNLSLRDAISMTKRGDPVNFILLGNNEHHPFPRPHPVWTFYLTRQGADESAGHSGELDILRGNLTIVGVGSNVVIDASVLGDRAFQVFSNATLTLENVTITGGRAPNAQPGDLSAPDQGPESGGAILNYGTVILKSCIISNNASGDCTFNIGGFGDELGADGGGICNFGTLVMNDCEVLDNFAAAGFDGNRGGNGGGILNEGSCFMTNCLVANNAAGAGGAPDGGFDGSGGNGGSGGGVLNAGSLVMDGCFVTNNGSGIGQNSSPGNTDNYGATGGTGGDGAGIFNSGAATLIDTSVAENLCGNGGDGSDIYGVKGGAGGTGGQGGGIFNSGTIFLQRVNIVLNKSGTGGSAGFGSYWGGNGGDGGGGAGIFNAGTASILDSTIQFNICGDGGQGGGLRWSYSNPFYYGGNGGNGGSGGGICNDSIVQPVPVLNLQNDTINSNQTGSGGNPGSASGQNSGNPGQDGSGPDISE